MRMLAHVCGRGAGGGVCTCACIITIGACPARRGQFPRTRTGIACGIIIRRGFCTLFFLLQSKRICCIFDMDVPAHLLLATVVCWTALNVEGIATGLLLGKCEIRLQLISINFQVSLGL